MSSEYDELLEQALAEYGRRRDQAVKTRADMDGLSETATAPRQVVQVTVDGLGRMTGLKFPTHAYKSMPAPDLAATIMKTLQEARDRVDGRAAEALSGSLPSTVDAAALLHGRVGLEDLLPREPAQGRTENE